MVLLALVAAAGVFAVGAAAEQASEPASPTAGRLDVGLHHSCALLGGGQVRCWGYGIAGQLGYGNKESIGDDETPASAGSVNLGSGRSATAISVGDYHTCAILDDGSVRCWGYGADGRLGYGNTDNVGDTPANTPDKVGAVPLGAGRTAKAITAGGGHTCAILNDSSVRCWGYGANGELGYGTPEGNRSNVGDTPATTPDKAGPVDLGAGRTAKAISAGVVHTCAVLDNGTVLCWGYGANGRLGYGNTGDTSHSFGDIGWIGIWQTPGQVDPVHLGPGRTATAISAGDSHTCAVLDDGSVRCWGFGFSGQLGYGNQFNAGDTPATTPDKLGPVDLGAGRIAKAITAGTASTCARLDNASVRCWGYGLSGRLGYGNTDNIGDNEPPGSVGPVDLGVGRSALAITAGGSHTCARLEDGAVRCWGYGGNGRLGYCNERTVGDDEPPASAGPVNLAAGDGGVLCAGPVPVSVSPPSIAGQAIAGQALSEVHGSWSPTPGGYGYQWLRCDGAGDSCAAIQDAGAQSYTPSASDVGSTIRVRETASTGGGTGISANSAATAVVVAAGSAAPVKAAESSDAARARGLRSCLGAVAAQAKRERGLLSEHGSARLRAKAKRRIAGHAASGRRRCLRLYGRTPGRPTGLRARALGKTQIQLSFTAPGTDSNHPPPARSYLIKQSPRPIRSARDFARAHTLCKGTCRFAVTRVAGNISLTVSDLNPHSTYYYAVVARDNVSARRGPRSASVKAKTR